MLNTNEDKRQEAIIKIAEKARKDNRAIQALIKIIKEAPYRKDRDTALRWLVKIEKEKIKR